MATVYEFDPVGVDLFSPHRGTPEKGALVVKTKISGAPKNGTMGHVFVADAVTGKFIGLVLANSLKRVTPTR
jgi:hypothetical protein